MAELQNVYNSCESSGYFDDWWYKLHKKMINTGKGYDEYMNSRRSELEKISTGIQTQPINENCDKTNVCIKT